MSIFSTKHAVWLAGFRPFFLVAAAFGALMPVLWSLVFSGYAVLPEGVNPLQWHAHEMLFGFGGAVLFGFLLTASKNWVKIRGIHGGGLMVLVGLWILERATIYLPIETSPVLRHLSLSMFVLASGMYIIWSLLKNRKNDFYPDNYFFIFLLVFVLLAKNLLVSVTYYQHGVAMSLGLFRLAFVVMFERTMTQFMKNTEQLDLYRNRFVDSGIKVLMAVAIFQSILPTVLSLVVLGGAAALLLGRWILWRPDVGLRKFGNATMYVGYLGLVLHLVLETLKLSGLWGFTTVSIHVFTFLCMGLVVASMIVRIANGHTGRKPQFLMPEKIIVSIVFLAAVVRLLCPLIWPAHYSVLIMGAGILWGGAYLGLFLRIIPLVMQPRIDGKVH